MRVRVTHVTDLRLSHSAHSYLHDVAFIELVAWNLYPEPVCLFWTDMRSTVCSLRCMTYDADVYDPMVTS